MGPSLAPYADTPRKVPLEGNPKPRKVPVQEHVRRPLTVFQPAALFSTRKHAGGSSCAPAEVPERQKKVGSAIPIRAWIYWYRGDVGENRRVLNGRYLV